MPSNTNNRIRTFKKNAFTPEEDTVIWNALHNRAEGVTMKQAISQVMPKLPNRSEGSATFRYYYLRDALNYTPEAPLSESKDALHYFSNLIDRCEAQAQELKELRADLQTEQNRTAYLRATISELEEDREAFLRLMDKARAIGRSEV